LVMILAIEPSSFVAVRIDVSGCPGGMCARRGLVALVRYRVDRSVVWGGCSWPVSPTTGAVATCPAPQQHRVDLQSRLAA